jgi:hypothetical protein
VGGDLTSGQFGQQDYVLGDQMIHGSLQHQREGHVAQSCEAVGEDLRFGEDVRSPIGIPRRKKKPDGRFSR